MTHAAQAKVAQALRDIEAAQVLLGNDCAALSPVVGLVKEWERIGKLYDKVKAEWHRLNQMDGPFRLDSEPKSAGDKP
jgi:hypothetical protein